MRNLPSVTFALVVLPACGAVPAAPSPRGEEPPANALRRFVPHGTIARPTVVEITDSAGTRLVHESSPSPVAHWEGATTAQRATADRVVADILRSADPEAPGALFHRATLSIRSIADRKAVVPRLLNAMFESYGDVQANRGRLAQLSRAMCVMTGFGVNYEAEDSGDATRDRALRESAVRQWFAFFWRHANTDLDDFLEVDEIGDPGR